MKVQHFVPCFLAVFGYFWSFTHGADVICPLEDYILTGTEFSKCQKEVLKSFSTDDSSSAPCNELKHVVDNCAKIVQVIQS